MFMWTTTYFEAEYNALCRKVHNVWRSLLSLGNSQRMYERMTVNILTGESTANEYVLKYKTNNGLTHHLNHVKLYI